MDGMRRFSICATVSALAMLWLSSPALAGGWAVTTLDALPQDLQAGTSYPIGYTIRVHGVKLFDQATPQIRISAGDQQLTFRGHRTAEPGHYVSEVTFPSAADWTWFVDPMPYPTQALGTISVLPVPVVESTSVVERAVAQLAPAADSKPPVEFVAVLSLLLLAIAGAGVTFAVYSTARLREPRGWLRACLGRTMRRARAA
jgi:hypothetical protein